MIKRLYPSAFISLQYTVFVTFLNSLIIQLCSRYLNIGVKHSLIKTFKVLDSCTCNLAPKGDMPKTSAKLNNLPYSFHTETLNQVTNHKIKTTHIKRFSAECRRVKTSDPSQSQRTPTIQWTIESSKQINVADIQSEETVHRSNDWFCCHFWLYEKVARVFQANRVA